MARERDTYAGIPIVGEKRNRYDEPTDDGRRRKMDKPRAEKIPFRDLSGRIHRNRQKENKRNMSFAIFRETAAISWAAEYCARKISLTDEEEKTEADGMKALTTGGGGSL